MRTEDASALRGIAGQLLARESGDSSDPLRLADAAGSAFRKLHDQLVRVVGSLAVQSIVVRAAKITQRESPFLSLDPAPDEGEYLKGLRESVREQTPDQVRQALTALLANFLGVLVSLVGRNLTLVFLQEAWPEMKIGWNSWD